MQKGPHFAEKGPLFAEIHLNPSVLVNSRVPLSSPWPVENSEPVRHCLQDSARDNSLNYQNNLKQRLFWALVRLGNSFKNVPKNGRKEPPKKSRNPPRFSILRGFVLLIDCVIAD